MVRFLSLTMTVSIYALLQAHIWPWRTRLSNLMDPENERLAKLPFLFSWFRKHWYNTFTDVIANSMMFGSWFGPSVAMRDKQKQTHKQTDTYASSPCHDSWLVLWDRGVSQDACLALFLMVVIVVGSMLLEFDSSRGAAMTLWFEVVDAFGFEVQGDDAH